MLAKMQMDDGRSRRLQTSSFKLRVGLCHCHLPASLVFLLGLNRREMASASPAPSTSQATPGPSVILTNEIVVSFASVLLFFDLSARLTWIARGLICGLYTISRHRSSPLDCSSRTSSKANSSRLSPSTTTARAQSPPAKTRLYSSSTAEPESQLAFSLSPGVLFFLLC
jgi:hypothetical protein